MLTEEGIESNPELGFLMMLADRLKKPVQEIMELSVLELDLWAAWFKREADATNKQAQKNKLRRR